MQIRQFFDEPERLVEQLSQDVEQWKRRTAQHPVGRRRLMQDINTQSSVEKFQSQFNIKQTVAWREVEKGIQTKSIFILTVFLIKFLNKTFFMKLTFG